MILEDFEFLKVNETLEELDANLVNYKNPRKENVSSFPSFDQFASFNKTLKRLTLCIISALIYI